MPSPVLSRRAVLRSLSTGGVVGLAGCRGIAGGSGPEPIPDATPGPDDWSTSGYDARNSRYNAGAAPPRSEPAVRWTREFRFCHDPVVRGTRVVLNAGDHAVGLRATDGERVWRSDSVPWGHPEPTLGTDRAYVTGPTARSASTSTPARRPGAGVRATAPTRRVARSPTVGSTWSTVATSRRSARTAA